jgi:hypothetical protein
MNIAESARHAHGHAEASFTVEAPLAEVFPLFDPIGERAWAGDAWAPSNIHGLERPIHAGAVFATSSQGQTTWWTISDFDSEQGRVRYTRFRPGHQLGTVEVRCAPLSAERTQVTVTYELTGLTPEGSRFVESFFAPPAYTDYIAGWAVSVAAVFERRKMQAHDPGLA